MIRKYGLRGSIIGLLVSIMALFAYPRPEIGYLGIAFLLSGVVFYLFPSEEPEVFLDFPRQHSYFRFRRLTNLISVPFTFLFIFWGIWAMVNGVWWMLVLLALLRIIPSLVIMNLTHGRRRRILEEVPMMDSLGDIETDSMCKVSGYIYETRTRGRRFGSTIYNVWLVDETGNKAFLPTVTAIQDVTESPGEGKRLVAAGPSTRNRDIAAVQPVADVVLPPEGDQDFIARFDETWKKTKRRRILTSLSGSLIYLLAITVLGWVSLQFMEYANPTLVLATISFLSSTFFGIISEKWDRETARYETGQYFEPNRSSLSERAREHREEHLRRMVERGGIPGNYLRILERLGEL